MFLKVITQFITLLYCLFFKINWFDFFKYKNKNATLVLWIWPCFPGRILDYFFRAIVLHDLAYLDALIKNKQPFKLVIGKKIGSIRNSTVIITPSELYNVNRFGNYNAPLLSIIQSLEYQNNKVIPNSFEIAYWENKHIMHQRFKEFGIHQPETLIIELKNINENLIAEFTFPALIKEVHSFSSKGIYKVNSKNEALNILDNIRQKGNQYALIQKIVEMKKDLRLIMVGTDIVLHYWRVNNSDEWRPTSTSFGSSVDFEYLPQKWKNYFSDLNNKLQISVGAYDITWENDDENNEPIILEVSTTFLPNPAPPAKYKALPYKTYKKKFFIKNPYFKGRANVIFDVRKKILQFHKIID